MTPTEVALPSAPSLSRRVLGVTLGRGPMDWRWCEKEVHTCFHMKRFKCSRNVQRDVSSTSHLGKPHTHYRPLTAERQRPVSANGLGLCAD
ncbi:hypothetical protein EVAR_68562_1 [Eumeta japonica]|uniref:Uncharacterized protein n=1 Tax=Eumeta variegata TaxID=151549 RepID=A0A4C2A9L3_EUMVA|nr:hypothetical protein EVAR_68562_1 [Eumeta japonica]